MLECGADPNVCHQYRNLLYDAISTQNLATIKVILNPKYGFDLEKMIQLIEYESPSSAHRYEPMIETVCLLNPSVRSSIRKAHQCLEIILKRLFGDGDRDGNGNDSTSTNDNYKEIKFKPRITRKAIEGAAEYSRVIQRDFMDLINRYLVIGNYSKRVCKMVDTVEYNYKIGLRLLQQLSKLKSFGRKYRKTGEFIRNCQKIIDGNKSVFKKCIDIINDAIEKDKLVYKETKLDWDYTFNQCLFFRKSKSGRWSKHSLLWFIVEYYEKTASDDICAELIKLMLSLGADPNGFNGDTNDNDVDSSESKERQKEQDETEKYSQSSHNDNVLLLACREEKGIEVIKLLLDSGADVNSFHFTEQQFMTPLSYASNYCDLELMQLILDGGYGFNWNKRININQRDDCNGQKKRDRNKISVIGRLSKSKAKIGEIIKCIDYILSFQQKMIDQQDKEEKEKTNKSKGKKTEKGGKSQEIYQEKVLLHFGLHDDRIDLNQWDIVETMTRHLHQYVGYQNDKIVKQVCNRLNPTGARLLFYFVKNGDIEMIKKLIQLFPKRFNNTKTSQTMQSCCTTKGLQLSPLSAAILFNQKECVEWMENDPQYREYFCHQDEATTENANVNENKNGKENESEKKIEVDVQDMEERMCELVSDEQLAKFLFGLLERGIQSEQIACDLIKAQKKCGDKRNWKYIINEWEFKVVQSRNKSTARTILFRAVEYDMKHLLRLVLSLNYNSNKFEINLEKLNPDGDTLLSMACQEHHTDIVKQLLDYGADPNFMKQEYSPPGCHCTPLSCSIYTFFEKNENKTYRDIDLDIIKSIVESDKFDWNKMMSLNYRIAGSMNKKKGSIFEILCDKEPRTPTRVAAVKYLFEKYSKLKANSHANSRSNANSLPLPLVSKDINIWGKILFDKDVFKYYSLDNKIGIDEEYFEKNDKTHVEYEYFYQLLITILDNLQHLPDCIGKEVLLEMLKQSIPGRNSFIYCHHIMFLLSKYGNFDAIGKILAIVPPDNDDLVEFGNRDSLVVRDYCNDACFKKTIEKIEKWMTPIQVAYQYKQHLCVEKMYQSQYFSENDVLDLHIQSDLKLFKNEFYNKIQQLKINDWQSLESILFNGESSSAKISKWIDGLEKQERKGGLMSQKEREENLSFLYEMNCQVFEDKKFDKLIAMIGPNAQQTTLNDNWFQYRRDQKISDYIYNKLISKNNKSNDNKSIEQDQQVLDRLGEIINNGLANNECPFTDSWLILAKKINQDKFIESIENCAKLGMPKVNIGSDRTKNKDKDKEKNKEKGKANTKKEKHQTFFKNFILESNVFAETLDESACSTTKSGSVTTTTSSISVEIKSNDDDNDNNNDKLEDESHGSLVFNAIELNIIQAELLKQKEYIKQEIIKLEKDFSQEWKKTKEIEEFNIGLNGNLQQNTLIDSSDNDNTDLMSKYGIKFKYSNEDELPNSGVNQFDGGQIYDEDEFLTSLLIRAHLINPKFQHCCENIFSNESVIGAKCHFTRGSVKLRPRCVVKARIDYNDRNYPKTSNILDFNRCSVICNTVSDLNIVIDNFIRLVNIENKGDAITRIVRIKNGFKNVKSTMDINEFNYSDIKMNVLIKYNDMCIVGEIQFLLSFMLNAKKLGHSYYAFFRRKEYYEKLHQLNLLLSNKDGVFVHNVLQTQILSQNKNAFSKLLHLLNDDELNGVRNHGLILKKLKQNHWKKGEKIFKSITT